MLSYTFPINQIVWYQEIRNLRDEYILVKLGLNIIKELSCQVAAADNFASTTFASPCGVV